MATNRGKDFENVIREAFERVSNTMVTRLPDPVQGYLGYRNICDFLIYHYPYFYCIECKSMHGNTLPFSNITDNQWNGMLKAAQHKGVIAGVICWWVDKDVTMFIPIQLLDYLHNKGDKSIRYDCDWNIGEPGDKPFTFKNVYECIPIQGKKKRVFFDYDMNAFFGEVENGQRARS